MAKKVKLLPMFQELKGRAQVSNRRPGSTATGIYLMQLREKNGATPLPRRRFVISVDPGASGSLPRPVKINHLGPASASSSPGARPERRVPVASPQLRPGAA